MNYRRLGATAAIFAIAILAPGLAWSASEAMQASATRSTSGATLTLIGLDGRRRVMSAAEIAALPRHRVELEIHGSSHVYEGPLLLDVLTAVDVPTGAALRGPALGHAVMVAAADGYRVALGLTELDPATRPNRIILADRVDGKGLASAEGPLRLVVEGDLRPARAARHVVTVTVIDLGALSD